MRVSLAGDEILSNIPLLFMNSEHIKHRASGKPQIYFLYFFVLLSLFSSEKSKIWESMDCLGKAQSSTFHVLFTHTFFTFFYNYSISLIIDFVGCAFFVLFALQYFWKMTYFFDPLEKDSKE